MILCCEGYSKVSWGFYFLVAASLMGVRVLRWGKGRETQPLLCSCKVPMQSSILQILRRVVYMTSFFVLHKFWVQNNLNFWFMGPFVAVFSVRVLDMQLLTRPPFRFPRFLEAFLSRKCRKDNSCVSFGSMVNFTLEGREISYIFRSFCAVCMVI